MIKTHKGKDNAHPVSMARNGALLIRSSSLR
jgi:hypothetical protein